MCALALVEESHLGLHFTVAVSFVLKCCSLYVTDRRITALWMNRFLHLAKNLFCAEIDILTSHHYDHFQTCFPSSMFLCQVRAGESLMKLVSDLKQFLILNDFPSVNDAISLQNQQLRSLQEECDKKLMSLRDEIAIDLYELEEEYYSSRYK